MFHNKKSNINLKVLESDIKGIIGSLKLIRDNVQNFSRETVKKIKVTVEQQKYLNSLDNFLNNIIPYLTSDENYSRIINIFSWESIYLSYISTLTDDEVSADTKLLIKKYLKLTINIT